MGYLKYKKYKNSKKLLSQKLFVITVTSQTKTPRKILDAISAPCNQFT